MNSENRMQESKSERAFRRAQHRVLSSPGKLICAAIILAVMLVFTLLPVSSAPGRAQGQQGQRGQQGQQGQPDNDSASQIQRGFAIAPVPLDLRGKNRALVGKGSYIVNAQGGCNDCHTSPPYSTGHDPFLGEPLEVNAASYLGGGTPFGPVLVSRNITPDEHGRPAGLTRDQFIAAMRTGIDKDGTILEVMPWPVFGAMTDGDLNAIYEYLSSIPSLPGPGSRDP